LFVRPEELESLTNQFGIDLAQDINNPYGLLLQLIEFVEGKFQLQEVKDKDTFGT
jgi:hypothetical protein